MSLHQEGKGDEQGWHSLQSRLVAKGYAQTEGIDYNEVFSMVVRHASIWVFLVLIAQYDLEMAQLDVKMVFLHGDL